MSLSITFVLALFLADPPNPILGLNDIVFPRKAYFARLKGEKSASEEAEGEVKERLTLINRQGFWQLVTDALKHNASGKTVLLRCAASASMNWDIQVFEPVIVPIN